VAKAAAGQVFVDPAPEAAPAITASACRSRAGWCSNLSGLEPGCGKSRPALDSSRPKRLPAGPTSTVQLVGFRPLTAAGPPAPWRSATVAGFIAGGSGRHRLPALGIPARSRQLLTA